MLPAVLLLLSVFISVLVLLSSFSYINCNSCLSYYEPGPTYVLLSVFTLLPYFPDILLQTYFSLILPLDIYIFTFLLPVPHFLASKSVLLSGFSSPNLPAESLLARKSGVGGR